MTPPKMPKKIKKLRVPQRIEPDIDKYGTLVRASFFADFLEVHAMRGFKAKRASLVDLIEDSYGGVRQILYDETETLDEKWTPTQYAEEAWTCLVQRAEILGEKYPFVVDDHSIRLRRNLVVRNSPYIGVLSIAIAHAFKLSRANHVEHLFEDVVADAMEATGLRVGRLGPLSRSKGGTFVDSMNHVSRSLGVAVNANATIRRRNANDEDVDLIGYLDWKDARKGKWYFVGQVTCAVSDDWRSKGNEPAVNDWKSFLGEHTRPTAFLAIPHHASDPALKYVLNDDVLVIDRPRLVQNLASLRAEQVAVIDSVMSGDMQMFTV